METLINIVMIICFINSMYWLIATIKGPISFKIFVKILGLLGALLPLLYLLKQLNII